MRMIHAITMALGVLGSAPCQEKPGKIDEENLQGTWILKSIEIQGKTEKAPDGEASFTFSKTQVTMKSKGSDDRVGTFKVNSGKSPKQLDMKAKMEKGKPDETMQCLYEFKDGRLLLAYSLKGPGSPRPKVMDSKEALIMTLELKK